MKFAAYKTSRLAFKNAGAAVSKNGGFTLIEVMVVIVIIGILSTLAYSSLTDMIFANRAKETAQTIRAFTERALMDAKRQNKVVRICVNGNAIISEDPTATGCGKGKEISREALSQSFSPTEESPAPGKIPNDASFNGGIESQIRIGLSGIADSGYFAACDTKGYCGGAVKLNSINSFIAYIKKGKNASWEAL